MIDYSRYEGHTPGPWGWAGVTQIATGKGSYVVATVGEEKRVCSLSRETQGTAALIADAPILLARCKELEAENKRLREALEEAENTIRWAAQESRGRVKAEIVGGWVHHADTARAALAAAESESAP